MADFHLLMDFCYNAGEKVRMFKLGWCIFMCMSVCLVHVCACICRCVCMCVYLCLDVS